MFVLLLLMATLRQANSGCFQPAICTENVAVQAEILHEHNIFRSAVTPKAANMLKMQYNQHLAATAQAWVDRCILAHGPPSTRMLDGYELGENLYYSTQPNSWLAVISAWHSEVAHYSYPNGSMDGQAIGHYTQLVWNTSYMVGCGVARCPNSIYFYGCHYYRAGNFVGVPPYKAGIPCASCPNDCVGNFCTNPCSYVNKFSNCASMKTNVGCGNFLVAHWCPASCRCPTEIIPVG